MKFTPGFQFKWIEIYMLTNQKIQKTIDEIKEITKLDIALLLQNGKPVCSTRQIEPDVINRAVSFAKEDTDSVCDEGCIFSKVYAEDTLEYVLVMYTANSEHMILAQMAASQIRTLISASAQKYDRNNFIQNILLGNMLNVDIVSKAKKLHIDEKPRVAFVIDTGNKGNDEAMELVKNLSNMKSGDFVTSIDTHSIVFIKDVSMISDKDMEDELADIAISLVDSIHMDVMIKVRVGYGNATESIEGIVESFRQATLALEVGRVFYAQKDTISYGKLGLGRLIYQLPIDLCEMFIDEVFGGKVPDILEDEEAMSTVNMFFENNLNISETARQLYVHRNTLVYRLERIQKAIGLDIRTFDDAMTFRIAVMVLAHIRNNKEY